MSNEAIKLELIEWLAGIKEPNVLQMLLRWKKETESDDWFADLSPEQRASIERGLAQAERGETIPSAEIRKLYGRANKG